MAVIVLLLLSLSAFAMVSGFNDGGNLVATYRSSRIIDSRRIAPLLIAAIALGPVIFGTAVSRTMALEVVNFTQTSSRLLAISVMAGVLTLVVTWRMRLPTSTTIALAGGIIGAAAASGQAALIHWAGVEKIAGGLVGSVVMGFMLAWLLTGVMKRVTASDGTPRLVKVVDKFQYLTILWQGLAYGANDQEKVIGLTAIVMMLLSHDAVYHVSSFDILFPLASWSVGLALGGSRIANTVGTQIIHLRPETSVTTQLAAAITVSLAAILGFPVSTTQATDGCIFGSGTMINRHRVHWKVVRKIIGVWIITMPIALAMGAVLMMLVRLSQGSHAFF
ncbi:inorganic phosphate transporter [Sulfobacillus sp. hq2]|uniref:inorganic phosphate transporter n=1 Tax=Sulfobacillus sp. hq2 TaxID=2039167 RepID=UPI001FA82B08|nr:inorganic phosphate transporter [Sulfobacillus sp. hq2]